MEERIEYNTIRDDFSIIEIENGQILKVKSTLVDAVNITGDDKKDNAKIGLATFTHVITPPHVERYGIEYSQGVATEKDHVKELNFNIVKEIVNIYETKKSIILVGMRVKKIFLTNKVNANNEPILRFESSNAMNEVDKPDYANIPKLDK